jgi:hypothetical protein
LKCLPPLRRGWGYFFTAVCMNSKAQTQDSSSTEGLRSLSGGGGGPPPPRRMRQEEVAKSEILTLNASKSSKKLLYMINFEKTLLSFNNGLMFI